MQQLNNLEAVVAESDRVVNGMLDGSMTRDDGLFATAATLKKLANEFLQFATYALPVIHQIHQAMIAAQAQMAQAQAQMAQAQAQAQAQGHGQPSQAPPQAPPQVNTPSANVVPIGAGATADVQVVGGTPGGSR